MRQDIWIGDVNVLCRLYVPHMGVPFIHQEPQPGALQSCVEEWARENPFRTPCPPLAAMGLTSGLFRDQKGKSLGTMRS